ncbi:MAG: bifunctional methylenetetrahydrofolate dehydrogenase/methenyltetrahydrofolate cyclohydrolase FolD [Candidatus Izemoplasmatales bacterium]
MIVIDGSEVAKQIRIKVKKEVASLVEKYQVVPHLAVILIGNNPASESYVSGKEKACEKTGIQSTVIRLNTDVTTKEVFEVIENLNQDPLVHGILLQLPIPQHLDSEFLIDAIRDKKDVDGFTSKNISKLYAGKKGMVPCTPKGIMTLLDYYNIDIESKQCTVLGRSQIVGKPMANLLLNRNGTVTICHSRTKDLATVCKNADILVVAVGKPKMVDKSFVKEGATVIDVGINRVDGVIVGDVDFESVSSVAAYLTPVPKGVGPMTIATLLENTLECYKLIVGENI